MKSLSEILENNREVAKELMCKNHKLHISFKKYQNIDIEIPFVLLSNKNGEPYETEVTDIALIGEKLCIKVVNTKDLSSDVKMDDEGYIDCIFCIYYSDDKVLLKTSNSMLPIPINDLSIDDMFSLLKHIHSSVK